MRTELVTMIIMAAALVVGCSGEPRQPAEQSSPHEQKHLTQEEKALLAELDQYEFHGLKYLNHKKLLSGDTNAIHTLSHNNSLWIKLYEASKNPEIIYGMKSAEITDEGDPVTTYYLARKGIVSRITDYSRDKFAEVGVTKEDLKPFLIGYTGYNLPCPCGSGKTWLNCNPGRCRSPTFVIVTEIFPNDEVLHWIPAPNENEKSMSWKYSPNKPNAGDGK
jgi:hypothetical protein